MLASVQAQVLLLRTRQKSTSRCSNKSQERPRRKRERCTRQAETPEETEARLAYLSV
ncbi:hypothetical protein JAAARDRAFT_301099 [Jaapia argillacea MUCL 33604]|uniref:Uncharacterized protein n=1 Tax=Jaapia argillacea MUCL 33604 TaxID=933084 RepID=A0A067PSG8_9AGAM|nr:hypothetical protein JAAARDRAFT_301099 [Jaapia argillacea MUCL 33604]